MVEINYVEKVLNKFKDSNGISFPTLYWNLWEDEDDNVSIDYSYGFCNRERSKALIETVLKLGEDDLIIYPDFGFVSDELEAVTLRKDIEKFNSFQKEGFLSSGLPTKFYIFDRSASWIIHVDESVLFCANKEVFISLLDKIGGEKAVLKSMESDLRICSGEAKEWREKIIEDFKQSMNRHCGE